MAEMVAPAQPLTESQTLPASKPSRYDYDIVIIGSGPAGHRAAIQSAKLGKRVAVIEKKALIGGVSVNTGTIPSKTLREAVLHLSGFRQRSIYGASYTVKQHITMNDLLLRADHVIRHEIEINKHQLQRNGVELFAGIATLVDQHTVHLNFLGKKGEDEITTRHIIIAVGTTVAKPEHIPFDGETIFTSDGLLKLGNLPRTLTVVGGGVIGCEYACMFATLGVRVTLVEAADRLLTFIDHEIVDALVYHMRQQRVTLRLGENVRSIEARETRYGSWRQDLPGERQGDRDREGAVRHRPAGRDGDAGLGEYRHRPRSSGAHQASTSTTRPRSPASTPWAMSSASPAWRPRPWNRGAWRPATLSALSITASPSFSHTAYTPYPEISTVGANEEDLTRAGVPYEVGKAYYKEIARGQILGDTIGMLKLIFHRENHKLLGVHIIGEGRERVDPHRADGDGLRQHGGLLHQHGLQLSHAGGVLQDGGV